MEVDEIKTDGSEGEGQNLQVVCCQTSVSPDDIDQDSETNAYCVVVNPLLSKHLNSWMKFTFFWMILTFFVSV